MRGTELFMLEEGYLPNRAGAGQTACPTGLGAGGQPICRTQLLAYVEIVLK